MTARRTCLYLWEHVLLIPLIEPASRPMPVSYTQLDVYKRQGLDIPRVSVNIAPCVLEQDDFHERLLDILHEHSIPPECLEIEITENVLVGDRQKVTDRLLRLSRERVRIAIDDFGTQYSSLGYLRYLPVNTRCV